MSAIASADLSDSQPRPYVRRLAIVHDSSRQKPAPLVDKTGDHNAGTNTEAEVAQIQGTDDAGMGNVPDPEEDLSEHQKPTAQLIWQVENRYVGSWRLALKWIHSGPDAPPSWPPDTDAFRNEHSELPHSGVAVHTDSLTPISAESYGDADHEQFDNNGMWPRRLLNVQTMTSHKWRPGNTYGGVANPTYSTLSYTWGRWRTEDDSVESLVIRGVPWEIPKIQPSHFTLEQFEDILQRSISVKPANSDEYSPFVWLDIACISQVRNDTIANMEVGRQARIFRNARIAFVWLTKADPVVLSTIFTRGFHDETGGDLVKDDEARTEDLKIFSDLLSDPWFSGVWTLEEMVLRSDSCIVTNKGFWYKPDSDIFHQWYELQAFGMFLVDMPDHARERLGDLYVEFQRRYNRSGLQSSLSASIMQIVATTFSRVCEDPLDKVYGIMQVFGDDARVGKARLPGDMIGRSLGAPYTLLELQDELGCLILQKHPAESQGFVHDEPPRAGRAWRICGEARVPVRLGRTTSRVDASESGEAPKTYCVFSTCVQGSDTWATFRGQVCPFDTIIQEGELLPFEWASPLYTVYQDEPKFNHPAGDDIGNDWGPFLDYYGRETFMVLLLSTAWIRGGNNQFRFEGLLLLAPGLKALDFHRTRRGWQADMDEWGSKSWARIGVLTIHLYSTTPPEDSSVIPGADTILGKSKHWQEREGIWG